MHWRTLTALAVVFLVVVSVGAVNSGAPAHTGATSTTDQPTVVCDAYQYARSLI